MSVFLKIKRYRELFGQRIDLKEQLDPIEKEMGKIGADIVADMQKLGVQSLNIEGVVYARRSEFYAKTRKEISRDELIRRLASFGLTDMLMLSPQTVKAKLREAAEQGKTLPPELLEVIETGKIEKLSVNGLKAAVSTAVADDEDFF
jgi:hypothetical protein